MPSIGLDSRRHAPRAFIPSNADCGMPGAEAARGRACPVLALLPVSSPLPLSPPILRPWGFLMRREKIFAFVTFTLEPDH